MKKRPTKSDLIREARTALTDTPSTDNVAAPFEPASAEVGEAFDLSEPETYAADMPEEDDDWFAEDDAQAFDELLDNESPDEPDDVRQRFNLESATDIAPPVNPIPASTLHAVSPAGTLIAHCGTRKISRDELAIIPAPPPTRTHQPVAHARR